MLFRSSIVLLIFFLLGLQFTDRKLLKLSRYSCEFIFFCLQFYQFLLYVLWYIWGVHMCVGLLYCLREFNFCYVMHSLSLIIFLILKFALSKINIANYSIFLLISVSIVYPLSSLYFFFFTEFIIIFSHVVF